MSIIKVKFFARIREEMGRAEDQVEFRPGLKVSDIWNRASGDDEMPEAMLVGRQHGTCQGRSRTEGRG